MSRFSCLYLFFLAFFHFPLPSFFSSFFSFFPFLSFSTHFSNLQNLETLTKLCTRLMSLLPLLYVKFLIFCIIGPQIIISSPDSFPKTLKTTMKQEQKLVAYCIHLSFVKTQDFQKAFSCVLFLLNYIILRKTKQKPLIKAIR